MQALSKYMHCFFGTDTSKIIKFLLQSQGMTVTPEVQCFCRAVKFNLSHHKHVSQTNLLISYPESKIFIYLSMILYTNVYYKYLDVY